MSRLKIEYHYIYMIRNILNNKTYIGQRILYKGGDPNDDNYMGSGKLIKLAIKKYGIENFTKEILAICGTREQANILEKVYIALYREIGKAEYNISDGGNGGDLGKEARKNMKQKMEEYWNSERGLRQKAKKFRDSKESRGCLDQRKTLV